MPASERSLRLTEVYRARLLALRAQTEGFAEQRWRLVDLANLEPSFIDWLGATAAQVARAQQQAARLSIAYLGAYLSSELGRGARTPAVDATGYIGRSRDGRPLSEAYDTARVGVLVALKGGAGNTQALDAGLQRALRAVELDTMHAARQTVLDGIAGDDRFTGWQRAVRGTCGACAGAATGVEDGLHFQVHPGCQCVSEPVVNGVPDTHKRPTGQDLFAAKTETEQDEMVGPEAAALVRAGEITLAELVDHSRLENEPDFLTQKPVAAL